MNKPLASELFGKLKPVLGEDEARKICKGKIDLSELEDDLGVAPVISAKAVESFLDTLQKALTPDTTPVAATATLARTSTLRKGAAQDPEAVDVEAAIFSLESLVKASSDESTRHYNQLVKGIVAIGDLQKANFVALAEIDRRNAEMNARVDTIVKAVESISKGGPKAVQTGTQVVTHPAETPDARAAALAASQDQVNVNAELNLYHKVSAHLQAQIMKGEIPAEKKDEYRFALGELESGALPSRVNTTYALGLS